MIYHLMIGRPRPGDVAPASLRDEGFVHLSTASQLPGTVGRYYEDVDDLVVLSVDPALLTAELRWERSTGDALFPHLYGPIDAEAVVGVTPWEKWSATAGGQCT